MYMLLMFPGTFLRLGRKILLEIGAGKTYRHPIYEYLNWRLCWVTACFGVLLLNTNAYKW